MRERFIPAVIKPELCVACGRCYRACSNHAIYFIGPTRNIDYKKCKGCLLCVSVCGQNAISVTNVPKEGVFAIVIDQSICEGPVCGVCVAICPEHLYHITGANDPEKKRSIQLDNDRLAECRGCHACADACDRGAITLLEFGEKAPIPRDSM